MTTTTETDAQLLERFLHTQDQRAFELVVERHAAMVLGVCLRVLANRSDAEDAAQAVFLTLARKAGSLDQGRSVAAWLHYVARCTARNARSAGQARARHEALGSSSMLMTSTPADDPGDALHDARLHLDEALASLPERYRGPLILFHLEGHSLADTARVLQSPVGTIGARLSRGRELLRSRLSRQGHPLESGTFGVLLASAKPLDAIPALSGAALAPHAIPASIHALSLGAMHIMQLTKIKILSLVAIISAVLAAAPCLVLMDLQVRHAHRAMAASEQRTHVAETRLASVQEQFSSVRQAPRSSITFTDLMECGVLDIEHETGGAAFIFTEQGGLSDKARTFLNLTPQEADRFQELLHDEHTRVASALRSAGAHREQRGDQVTISLPALGAQGIALRDDTQRRFAEVLGETRGILAWNIVRRYWDDAFLGFGIAKQSLVLRRLTPALFEISHYNDHGNTTRDYTILPWKYALFEQYLTAQDPGCAAATGAMVVKPPSGF